MASEKARLTGEILLTYARVRWLLPRHSLPRTVEMLRRPAEDRTEGREAERVAADAWRCAEAVVRVLRLLPADSRCLVRSLVLLAVLARRGTGASLVVGVLAEPSFAAHAWVEHRGVPLLEPGPAGAGRLVEL